MGFITANRFTCAYPRRSLERKIAYERARAAEIKTWKGEGLSRRNVKPQPEIVGKTFCDEIDRLCSLDIQLQHIDETFKALG